MKQEIIEKMSAELYDSWYCQEDFSHDMDWLTKNDEPFFWMVREHGTALMPVGGLSIAKVFEKKDMRFSLFRDFNCLLGSFKYYAAVPETKLFYWDGYVIQDVVSYQDLCEIWSVLAKPFYDVAVQRYSEEYERRNDKLEMVFISERAKEKYEAALKHAEEIGDSSLKHCMEHLTNYVRCSLDHYIEIGRGFFDNDFGFAIMVDGKCSMNGGIIYYSKKSENRWQIHT